MSGDRSSWNLTAAAMALVVVTALVAGLVVASWTGEARDGGATSVAVLWPVARDHARTPTAMDVGTCQAQARAEAGDQPLEAGVDTVATGAANGFDGVRSHEARYVRAYRACLRERGFTS